MQTFKTLKYIEKTVMLSAAELSKWVSLIVVREQLPLPIFTIYINEMLKSLMLLFMYSYRECFISFLVHKGIDVTRCEIWGCTVFPPIQWSQGGQICTIPVLCNKYAPHTAPQNQ